MPCTPRAAAAAAAEGGFERPIESMFLRRPGKRRRIGGRRVYRFPLRNKMSNRPCINTNKCVYVVVIPWQFVFLFLYSTESQYSTMLLCKTQRICLFPMGPDPFIGIPTSRSRNSTAPAERSSRVRSGRLSGVLSAHSPSRFLAARARGRSTTGALACAGSGAIPRRASLG